MGIWADGIKFMKSRVFNFLLEQGDYTVKKAESLAIKYNQKSGAMSKGVCSIVLEEPAMYFIEIDSLSLPSAYENNNCYLSFVINTKMGQNLERPKVVTMSNCCYFRSSTIPNSPTMPNKILALRYNGEKLILVDIQQEETFEYSGDIRISKIAKL